MVKVLITGGAGYLGSTLTQHLLDNGYTVHVLDNLMYKQTSLLHYCDVGDFNFIKGDVTDKTTLQALVAAPIPTPTAIITKYIGKDLAIAAIASADILPANQVSTKL